MDKKTSMHLVSSFVGSAESFLVLMATLDHWFPATIETALKTGDLIEASVLSGN